MRTSVLSVISCVIALSAGAENPDLVIWDDTPAANWDVAYPVGNGRLGAMPFANFPKEKILINEESIWGRSDARLQLAM